MRKIAGSGSGSISQRHKSADPDPDPDSPPKCHGSATLLFYFAVYVFFKFYLKIFLLRICPDLNVRKRKSTQPVMMKAAKRPRVTCPKCGLSVLDKFVLKRHVCFFLLFLK